MASSLSDDEFHRMQMQLIELRTENYTLNESCKKQAYTITDLTEKVASLDRDFQKAQKTIQKSKKAKEIEALIQDNDVLQRKLLSQEEEFSLQSSTLMQELSTLVAKNEAFEREVSSLSNGSGDKSRDEKEQKKTNAELTRLQAENTVLHNKAAGQYDRYEEEMRRLREQTRVLQEVNSELEAQCAKLAGKRGTPAGDDNSEDRTVEGVSDSETLREEEGGTNDTGCSVSEHDETSRLRNSSFTELMSMVNESENTGLKLQNQLRELDDLKLKYDTIVEENRLLKEKSKSFEHSSSEQVDVLQADVHKLTEKLRKKQESFLQIQEEKENMYTQLSKRLDELEAAKEQEVNSLMEQNQRMQEEIIKATQEMEDYKERTSLHLEEMQDINSSLNIQVDAATAETRQQLEKQNDKFQGQLEDLDSNLARSLQDVEDMRVQLKEAQHAHHSTLEQLHDAQTERDKQIQALQETMKVAEKRKTLLDEMAIKYQVECDDHRESVKEMEEKYKETVKQLQAECDKYQNKMSSLGKDQSKILSKETEKYQVLAEDHERVKVKCEELTSQIASLDETKGWLERRLSEVEETLKTNKNHYENDIFSLKQEHTRDLVQISDSHSTDMKNLNDEIRRIKKEKEVIESRMEQQNQVIKDSADEIRLHDKKAAAMMKDLKRQLHAERKRNDRLQEKLQEFFADNKNKLGVDELFRPIEGVDRIKGDNSSISSWSMSGVGKDASSMATTASLPSPKSDNSPSETPPSVLEHENNDLLNRLTELQERKWQLEERVSILEGSNSAMAEDLLKKTAIIDHYVMDSRTAGNAANNMSPTNEKISLRRMVDYVKEKGGEDNTREMNKKLQNMLEETLTKNMHLQKDMEVLSRELVRLSKTPVETPNSNSDL